MLSILSYIQSRSTIHLQPSDDEVEEEGDDGEQVDEVHGAHHELELARAARQPDLKYGRHTLSRQRCLRLVRVKGDSAGLGPGLG